MGKDKQFKKLLPKSTTRFKPLDEAPINYDSLTPAFSFRYMKYHGKNCLSQCDQQAQSFIVEKLLRMSQLTWRQIISAPKKGLGYEPIPRNRFKVPLPSVVTPEVPLLVFRFSDSGRMAGFRDKDIYHIIVVGSTHNLY